MTLLGTYCSLSDTLCSLTAKGKERSGHSDLYSSVTHPAGRRKRNQDDNTQYLCSTIIDAFA